MLNLVMMSVIFGSLPFWKPIEDDPVLAKAVSEVESLRRGKATDFMQLEDVATRLLAEIEEPESQGILLFHVVNVYAQSGMQNREKLMAHIDRAETLLREPTRRAAPPGATGDGITNRAGSHGRWYNKSRRWRDSLFVFRIEMTPWVPLAMALDRQ